MSGTRDKLIAAGVDLFYRNGFQAVGLDQILDIVGITKTAFYKHFDSKDDLIIAVLEKRDGDDIAEMVRFMRDHGGSDPRAQVLAMFDHLGAWFRDPGFRGCLFMNASTEFPTPSHPIHQAAAAHGAHMAAVLRSLLVQAGAAKPDALTRQLMLLVAGAIAARHMDGDLEAAKSARHAAEVLMCGVNGAIPAGR